MTTLKNFFFQKIMWKMLLSILAVLIAIAALSGCIYGLITLQQENLTLKDNITGLENNVTALTNENAQLNLTIQGKQSEVSTLNGQVAEITTTVNGLQKLSQLDPELLKKYSKVYFLNENYVPKSLSYIDQIFLYYKDKPLQILTNVNPFLQNLLNAAAQNGLSLLVISAYRSFGTQGTLKAAYDVTYGAGTANQFSAEQGYSEHQLGTAVDFTTKTLGASFDTFDKTAEYKWLLNNAYIYGFVLSYPQNNSYYVFEPWHWRFVGIKLATTLHQENRNFYDMDQSEIDQFLINIFDQ